MVHMVILTVKETAKVLVPLKTFTRSVRVLVALHSCQYLALLVLMVSILLSV